MSGLHKTKKPSNINKETKNSNKRAKRNQHTKRKRSNLRKLQLEQRQEDRLYEEARLDPETVMGQIKLDIDDILINNNKTQIKQVNTNTHKESNKLNDKDGYFQYLYTYLLSGFR